MSQKINIVMFNMSTYSSWQEGVVNRNYHILHALAKDDRVANIIAVDFLPFSFRRAIKMYVKDHIIKDTKGTVIFGDLTSQCWRVSSKILVYSTIDSVWNKKRVIREIKKIVERENMGEHLVVWSCNPLFTDYLGAFDGATYVFDAIDNWSEHASYQSQKKQLLKNYEKIGVFSDIIFSVSEEMKSFFHQDQKIQWVPNGVDVDHFSEGHDIAPALAQLPKPVVGFLGILQERIDTELLRFIAHKNTHGSLVLAGPVWKDFQKEKLNDCPNIHFLGPISYQEMPSIYRGFDVGIVPYKNSSFVQSTNSMKVYEYLASGIPVVATKIPGMEVFGDLVYTASNKESFWEKIEGSLKENTPELVAARRAVLTGKTWGHRVSLMLDMIAGKIHNFS